MELVEITEQSHPVVLDLRYGSLNNFTNQTIYTTPRCFLHTEALPLLEKAIDLAAQQDLRFKIFDAFRPKAAQESLWSICPNPMYVTPPEKGSPHTRGVAIDLTLVNSLGEELPMGTPFDDFTEQSHHGALVSRDENANRYTLLGIMMCAGWDFYKNEWWHYQLFNAQTNYPLIAHDYGMMT
jgi:D-alanyl-D-alanine dipeptidase